MKTHVQAGKVLDLAAPYDRTSGQGALIGSIFGVACHDVLSGVTGTFMTSEVHTLTKTSAQSWVVGDKIYWDDTNKRCDNVGTVGSLIGVATAAAANPSTLGTLKILDTAPRTASTIAALTDNSGGAAADGTIGVVTPPTALTGAGSGTADGALQAEGSLATAGGNTYTDAAVNTILVKIENNIAELVAFQTAAITAITANRDAIKELATKQNEVVSKLQAAGVVP